MKRILAIPSHDDNKFIDLQKISKMMDIASYDEETFSDRNVFPIGCIKELRKIEI